MKSVRVSIFWATLTIVNTISLTTEEKHSTSWWIVAVIQMVCLVALWNNTSRKPEE